MLTNMERSIIYKKQNKSNRLTRAQERRMLKKLGHATRKSWMPYYEHI